MAWELYLILLSHFDLVLKHCALFIDRAGFSFTAYTGITLVVALCSVRNEMIERLHFLD